MPTYNKLVRDRISWMIAENGGSCRTRVLNESEFIEELGKKLQEEVNECLNASEPGEVLGELADVLEVLRALTVAYGFSLEQLEEQRVRKAEQRGGFQERIYLIDVDAGRP